jgi:hypothetical protein
MNRNVYTVTLKVESYIAEPYWPELDDLINIQKKSGVNRCKSEAKREASLKAYLKQEGISPEAYAALESKAKERWYKDEQGRIFIPRHHLAGCLVQTVKTAPAAIRGKFDADSFRHHVRISDFATDKKVKDELFDRYVKNEATNQRRRSISEVITDFPCVGTVEINEMFKEKDFHNLLTYALSETGLGSCRKMGYGRGSIMSIEEADEE